MNENISVSTGNETVDRVTKLDISGNVTPAIWRYTIVNEKGRPNHIAIDILADIVYWYKACEERGDNGCFVGYKKKFKDDDYLQRSYEQIVESMNISKNQARDAVVFLEELGVIKRIFRTIDTPNGRINNVMYIALNAEVLEKLTFPKEVADSSSAPNEVYDFSNTVDTEKTSSCEDKDSYFEIAPEPICKSTDSSMEISREVSGKVNIPVEKYAETNTYITTENTPDTTTTYKKYCYKLTPLTTHYAHSVFDGLNLTDDEIEKVMNAADYVVGRCEQAVNLLKKQSTPINNVVGWLIAAIKNGYMIKSYDNYGAGNNSHVENMTKHVTCGSFGNYKQRDIDFDALAKKVFAN